MYSLLVDRIIFYFICVLGIPEDTRDVRTSTIHDNGFNPTWNEVSFVSNISYLSGDHRKSLEETHIKRSLLNCMYFPSYDFFCVCRCSHSTSGILMWRCSLSNVSMKISLPPSSLASPLCQYPAYGLGSGQWVWVIWMDRERENTRSQLYVYVSP